MTETCWPFRGDREVVRCAQGGLPELLPQVNARPCEWQVSRPPMALNVISRVVFSVMAFSALAVLCREKAEFEFPEELSPPPPVLWQNRQGRGLPLTGRCCGRTADFPRSLWIVPASVTRVISYPVSWRTAIKMLAQAGLSSEGLTGEGFVPNLTRGHWSECPLFLSTQPLHATVRSVGVSRESEPVPARWQPQACGTSFWK